MIAAIKLEILVPNNIIFIIFVYKFNNYQEFWLVILLEVYEILELFFYYNIQYFIQLFISN